MEKEGMTTIETQRAMNVLEELGLNEENYWICYWARWLALGFSNLRREVEVMVNH